MKKSILIFSIFSIFFLVGCSSLIQVIDTKSTNTIEEDNHFVYETDSVKITYTFWDERGVMAFAIYNKLDKPIYIDWKHSSYINNEGAKFDYWKDKEVATSTTLTREKNYIYTGDFWGKNHKTSRSVSKSTTTTAIVKPERITFLPPATHIYKSKFVLFPLSHFTFDEIATTEEVPHNAKPSKTTAISYVDFSKEESPLIFRNFLTFSTDENFEEKFYIDNEFYISNIKNVEERHFKQSYYNEQRELEESFPFQKGTSFYVELN